MKKNLRNNRGITLIALVITIIVLLILAGVTLTLIGGDKGIANRAKNAAITSEIAGLTEESTLAVTTRNLDRVQNSEMELKHYLETEITGSKTIETAKVGDSEYTDVYYITRNGVTVTVLDDGTIEEGKVPIWDGTSKAKPEVDKNRNWHIYTPEEMKFFADFVNGNLTEEEKEGLEITADTIVYLESDLDMGARSADGVLEKGTAWTPVGLIELDVETDDLAQENIFEGTFEGNNHTIKGVFVKYADTYKSSGLFGYANVIQNLTIKDSYFDGYIWVGGICGFATNVENCHNKNTKVDGEVHVRWSCRYLQWYHI